MILSRDDRLKYQCSHSLKTQTWKKVIMSLQYIVYMYMVAFIIQGTMTLPCKSLELQSHLSTERDHLRVDLMQLLGVNYSGCGQQTKSLHLTTDTTMGGPVQGGHG